MISRSVVIINYFFFVIFTEVTVNIHVNEGSKGERTLKIFKLSNNDQNLEVTVCPDGDDRLRLAVTSRVIKTRENARKT